MELGGEGDYIPIATLSPPEASPVYATVSEDFKHE